jgi:protease-4
MPAEQENQGSPAGQRSGTGPGGAAPTVVINQSQSFGSRLRMWLIVTLLMSSLLANYSMYVAYNDYFSADDGPGERFHSGDAHASDKLALIRIAGTIMPPFSDRVVKTIKKAKDDKHVKGILLVIDSPGGTVTDSHQIYHRLKELVDKKPIVVSMGSLAASGGYFVAMGAGTKGKIFAEPTTWTGSIGVIIPHYTVADLLQKWDIQDDSVVSGKFKAMASPTRKLTPEVAEEEHQILQSLVDQSFDQFKELVREARPQLANNNANWKTATTGQVFTAKQALDLGLVDKLGYIEDAVDRAIELAKLDPRNVRVVKYTPPESLFGSMLVGPSAQSAGLNLSALLEMTTPRAYYLCSWLPSLIANHTN